MLSIRGLRPTVPPAHISRLPLMTDQPAQEIRLLRAAYAAFNARDIGAALTLMTADVTWPKAFKGGIARGPDEIRAYWTEQWSEIDPHVEPIGRASGRERRVKDGSI